MCSLIKTSSVFSLCSLLKGFVHVFELLIDWLSISFMIYLNFYYKILSFFLWALIKTSSVFIRALLLKHRHLTKRFLKIERKRKYTHLTAISNEWATFITYFNTMLEKILCWLQISNLSLTRQYYSVLNNGCPNKYLIQCPHVCSPQLYSPFLIGIFHIHFYFFLRRSLISSLSNLDDDLFCSYFLLQSSVLFVHIHFPSLVIFHLEFLKTCR